MCTELPGSSFVGNDLLYVGCLLADSAHLILQVIPNEKRYNFIKHAVDHGKSESDDEQYPDQQCMFRRYCADGKYFVNQI